MCLVLSFFKDILKDTNVAFTQKLMSQTILPAARTFFGLPLKDDGINGNGDDHTDGDSASDGTYRC